MKLFFAIIIIYSCHSFFVMAQTDTIIRYGLGVGYEYGIYENLIDNAYNPQYNGKLYYPDSAGFGDGYYIPVSKGNSIFILGRMIFPKLSGNWSISLLCDVSYKQLKYLEYTHGDEHIPLRNGLNDEITLPYWKDVRNEYLYQNVLSSQVSGVLERCIGDKLNIGIGLFAGLNIKYNTMILGSKEYYTVDDYEIIYDYFSHRYILNRENIKWSEKKQIEWTVNKPVELIPFFYGISSNISYPVKIAGVTLLPEGRFRLQAAHRYDKGVPSFPINGLRFNYSFNYSIGCSVMF